MTQSHTDELRRSIWDPDGFVSDTGSFTVLSGQELSPRTFKVTNVHDYKDRFLLRFLQKEALYENPGFMRFEAGRQRATMIWVKVGGEWEPAGYCIIRNEGIDHPRGEERSVLFPETLVQVFVSKGHRRKGLGRALLYHYAQGRAPRPLWVESPKWQTREILRQMDYEESRDRYEVWQMMEGLSKWVRRPDHRT